MTSPLNDLNSLNIDSMDPMDPSSIMYDPTIANPVQDIDKKPESTASQDSNKDDSNMNNTQSQSAAHRGLRNIGNRL